MYCFFGLMQIMLFFQDILPFGNPQLVFLFLSVDKKEDIILIICFVA